MNHFFLSYRDMILEAFEWTVLHLFCTVNIYFDINFPQFRWLFISTNYFEKHKKILVIGLPEDKGSFFPGLVK